MKSLRVRLFLLAFLLALCGLGGYVLLAGSDGTPAPADEGPIARRDGNEPCRACHPAIYQEWRDSYHGRAWTDPRVRTLSVDFSRSRDCWPCHAPNPAFLDGLGRPPTHRSFRRKEGVGCLACHYTPRGAAARKDAPGARCRPVALLDEKTSVDLCVGCHNQHGTVDEWKTSRYYLDKSAYRDCSDCHMPERTGEAVQGRPPRAYASHAWTAGHDLAFLRRAARVRCRVEGRTVHVEVENHGCGHNFPTDSRHRAAEIEVDLPDKPHLPALIYERFRNPYRNEGGENTQLRPGAVVRRSAGLPPGPGRVRVRLLYLPKPWNQTVTYELDYDGRIVLFEKVLDYE